MSLNLLMNRTAKRLIDVFVACIVLLLVFPLAYIVIAFRIWRSMPGSILFKQQRSGLNGKMFTCYKFRTMLPPTREQNNIMDDEEYRTTPFGKYLRLSGLDELPQFWNVLLGHMTVVGPRPHKLSHDEEYARMVADYSLRYSVKPGITGWAQVNGFRGPVSTPEMIRKRVEYDLWYINNWSIGLDVKIMAKTFGIIWKQL